MSSDPRIESYAKPILDKGILGKRKNPSSIDSRSSLKHKFFIKFNPSLFVSCKNQNLPSLGNDTISFQKFDHSSNLSSEAKKFTSEILHSKKNYFTKVSGHKYFHRVSSNKFPASLMNQKSASQIITNNSNLVTSSSDDSDSSSTVRQKISPLKFITGKKSEAFTKTNASFSNSKKISNVSKNKLSSTNSIYYTGFTSSPSSSDFSSNSPILNDRSIKETANKTFKSSFQTSVKNDCRSSSSEILKKTISKTEQSEDSHKKANDFTENDNNNSKPKMSRVMCTTGRGQKPRWQRQDLMVYMALCNIPGQVAKRAELLKAAVELDIKIAKEKGIPRTFSGKTPVNSASACLTTNKYNLYSRVDKPGSRFQYFTLTFPPGDFDFAVKKYKEWEARLYEKFYPTYFSQNKSLSKSPQIVPEKKVTEVKITEKTKSPQIVSEKEVTEVENTEKTKSPQIVPDKEVMEFENIDKTKSPQTVPEKELTEVEMTEKTKSLQTVLEKEVTEDENTEATKSIDSKTISPVLIPSPSQAADVSLENNASKPVLVTFEALSPSKSRDSISPLPSLNQDTNFSDNTDSDSKIPKSWKDILEVKTSSIPNAGSGLFATRFIPAQSILGYYFGTPMTEYDFDNIKDQVGLASHYSIMYQTMVLDATDPEGLPFLDPEGPIYCPFHFMNEHPVKVNAAFLEQPENNQIACVTILDIFPGQELFVFYGTEFEREHYTLDF